MVANCKRIVASGILFLALSGCTSGTKEPTLVDAGGTVTYKGAPLSGAVVTFVPDDGPLAFGLTDLSGKFKLMTGGTKPGVAVGPASVTIEIRSADEANAAPEFKKTSNADERRKMQEQMMQRMQTTGAAAAKPGSPIPKKYADINESNLRFTVSTKAAENDFSITLPD